MRNVGRLLALVGPMIFTGCGYIHFGRMPGPARGSGDAALAAAYTDLATEHKILKQELALVRKEGDALRTALDKTGGNTGPGDMIARLNETSRELATLRATHAKLQAARAAPAAALDSSGASRLVEIEDKLATSLLHHTELRDENTRLRADVDRTRDENFALADQLKSSTAQNQQAQAALAQLNLELLDQKQARARAEHSAESVRTQLSTVLAAGSLETARPAPVGSEPAPVGSSSLQLAKAPPADSSPTAELRMAAELSRSASPVDPADATKLPRAHIVQSGDTLELLARRYYNSAERWWSIYEANTALLGSGQPLRAGMELRIPEVFAPQKPK